MSGTKEIMREVVAFNGNTVRLIYSMYDLGDKYSIWFKKPDEYGFRYEIAFGTMGEATRYFDLMITGGKR